MGKRVYTFRHILKGTLLVFFMVFSIIFFGLFYKRQSEPNLLEARMQLIEAHEKMEEETESGNAEALNLFIDVEENSYASEKMRSHAREMISLIRNRGE